jgi:hypothetical protein
MIKAITPVWFISSRAGKGSGSAPHYAPQKRGDLSCEILRTLHSRCLTSYQRHRPAFIDTKMNLFPVIRMVIMNGSEPPGVALCRVFLASVLCST